MNNLKNTEIERKFLIHPALTHPALAAMLREGLVPDLVMDIQQCYLAVGEVEIRIGLRQDVGKPMTAKLCFKQGLGLVRTEIEQAVELEKALSLFNLGQHTVMKRRYRFGRWEIDFYEHDHQGLVTAEVELASADEATPAAPYWLEPWVVREVTDEPAYKNSALAVAGAYVPEPLFTA